MKKTLTIAVVAVLLAATFAGCGCEKSDTAPQTTTTETTQTATELATDEQGNTYFVEATKAATEASGSAAVKAEKDSTSPTTAKDKAKTEPTNSTANKKADTSNSTTEKKTTTNSNTSTNNSTAKTNTNTNTNNSGNSGNSNSGNSNNAAAADPHAGKTWHEAVYKTIEHPAEYREVKVIDQEGYTYEEPIYEWRTICNVCGADITGNIKSHMSPHMQSGEGGRYHDDYIQVGSKTVTVPEQSHTENELVKDAWTEKVLVKEAGWY